MFSEAPNRAYTILERALALYESAGDARGQARTYGNMGIVGAIRVAARRRVRSVLEGDHGGARRRNSRHVGRGRDEPRRAAPALRRIRQGARSVQRSARAFRGGEAQRVSARRAVQPGARRARSSGDGNRRRSSTRRRSRSRSESDRPTSRRARRQGPAFALSSSGTKTRRARRFARSGAAAKIEATGSWGARSWKRFKFEPTSVMPNGANTWLNG